MIVNLLTKTSMPFADRASEAIQMTLLGMCAVFSVLAVIWFVLLLFKVFFYKDPNKKSKKEKSIKLAEPVVENQAAAVQDTNSTNNSDDATIAAIMAEQSTFPQMHPRFLQVRLLTVLAKRLWKP